MGFGPFDEEGGRPRLAGLGTGCGPRVRSRGASNLSCCCLFLKNRNNSRGAGARCRGLARRDLDEVAEPRDLGATPARVLGGGED